MEEYTKLERNIRLENKLPVKNILKPKRKIIGKNFLLVMLPITIFLVAIGLIIYIWSIDNGIELEKTRTITLQMQLSSTDSIKLSNAELSLRLDSLAPIFLRDQDVGAVYNSVSQAIVPDVLFIPSFSKDFSGLYQMKFQSSTVLIGTNAYDKLLTLQTIKNLKLISMTKSPTTETYTFLITFNYAN